MATFSNENRNGRIRTTMQIKPGERVKLCRCWRSATFPFCDSSHKLVADQMGPLTIEAELPSPETETPPPQSPSQ